MSGSVILVSGGGIIAFGMIAIFFAVAWLFIIILRIGFNPREYEKERARKHRGVHPRDAQESLDPSGIAVGDALSLIDAETIATDNRFVVAAKMADEHGNYYLFSCSFLRRGAPVSCVISAFRGLAEDMDPPWVWGVTLNASELSLSKTSRYRDAAESIRGVVQYLA